MTFEKLSEKYIPEVAAIEAESMDEPWSENALLAETKQPSSCLIVGVEDGKVACYGGLRSAADEADVLFVAVRADLRGQGLGKSILLRLINEAKDMGLCRMFLEVREGNAPAIALYESCGFLRTGVRKKYYQNRCDALLYALDLRGGLEKG